MLGDGIPFDLLILDIMMPGPSGLDICRDVRSRSAVPIIVLTAKDAEVDKVVGLEVGADDYVTKPFSVRELLGRVRAQLRRRELDRSPLAQAVKIEAGPVAIDLVRHVATVRGEPVNLTRSEFQLLRLLVGRPGEVFARAQIMEELWQTEFDGDERACDVHISNLRQKVERDPQRPELVLTVRGVGYKFNGEGPREGGVITEFFFWRANQKGPLKQTTYQETTPSAPVSAPARCGRGDPPLASPLQAVGLSGAQKTDEHARHGVSRGGKENFPCCLGGRGKEEGGGGPPSPRVPASHNTNEALQDTLTSAAAGEPRKAALALRAPCGRAAAGRALRAGGRPLGHLGGRAKVGFLSLPAPSGESDLARKIFETVELAVAAERGGCSPPARRGPADPRRERPPRRWHPLSAADRPLVALFARSARSRASFSARGAALCGLPTLAANPARQGIAPTA